METILNEHEGTSTTEPTGTRYTYTRDMMMKIRESDVSNKRPDYLLPEFNDEKGRFVLNKWFDHMYANESSKSGVAIVRKKNLSKMEDELGLSPQRRQFAGGCIPGSTKNTNTSTKWSNGRNDNNSDKKMNNRNKWRKKNEENVNHRQKEAIPEWMESDITVKDVMELKGFDGPPPVVSKLSQSKPRMLSECDILEEIQRKAPNEGKTEEAVSGSRLLHLFKKDTKSSNPELEEKSSSNVGILNNLFEQKNSDMPSMPFSGMTASEIESRFSQNNNRSFSPDPLEVLKSPLNAPDVYIPNKSVNDAYDDDDDDILTEILRKTSISDVDNAKEPAKDIFTEKPDRSISPLFIGLPSFDVHHGKTISSPQNSIDISQDPPGFAKQQNGGNSSVTRDSNTEVPPFNYSNYNNFHPMFLPGPHGLPMYPPYGMPFPGMMPNMRMPTSQPPPPPPNTGSNLNLPTSVLLKKKVNGSRNSPEVHEGNINVGTSSGENKTDGFDDLRRKRLETFCNNEHSSMGIMNMYNMMMFPREIPPQSMSNVHNQQDFPLFPNQGVFNYPNPQLADDKVSKSSIGESTENSAVNILQSEPVQTSQIPESIMKAIPKTAKMMTVEDLERALLAKK